MQRNVVDERCHQNQEAHDPREQAPVPFILVLEHRTEQRDSTQASNEGNQVGNQPVIEGGPNLLSPQPDHVYKMPVPGDRLESEVIVRLEMAFQAT